MRVLVITTSRADYGIYHSLLRRLAEDPGTELGLVVGGTHLSAGHGRTVDLIERDGYPIVGRVESVPARDNAAGVADTMGTALRGFAAVWAREAATTDYVVALGDRYEMFAAVAATVPFNLRVVHLHGGETSLGAIDDKFRHAITVMSTLHFTATEGYAVRVRQLVNSGRGVYAVGAPALDGLEEMDLYSPAELRDVFGTDFTRPTILTTFHPETVAVDDNEAYGRELCAALRDLAGRYACVITMPNADTAGTILRAQFTELAAEVPGIQTIENFGKKGYFSAMKHCAFLLGNTSSGIIEAASFGKYAINVGARQDGRTRSDNLIDVPAERGAIRAAVDRLEAGGLHYGGENVYRGAAPAAEAIFRILKEQL